MLGNSAIFIYVCIHIGTFKLLKLTYRTQVVYLYIKLNFYGKYLKLFYIIKI